MLAPLTRPASASTTTALLVGGLAALLVGLPLTVALRSAPAATPACALAFDLAALPDHARTIVARRQLACADVTAGRISRDAYREAIATIDHAWTAPRIIAPPATQWASTVRGFSTQYTETSWAASKVLGAPDVYPRDGDHANAWASLSADAADEWIEVGFAQPMRTSGVEIYETFNPGAITAIELITASGARLTAYAGAPHAAAGANRFVAEVGCTNEPIVAVHVRLASTQVVGWNELDAIGLVPCADR